MITVSNISLSYGKRALFKEVNLKFTPGNCYGLIGANGAGKSTFLKILSGEIEADVGDVIIPPNQRMAVLEQDQFKYDDATVVQTVIMGHKKLFAIMSERDDLYSKAELTDAEGLRVGEIESEFADMGGYEAEAEAATLLDGLGITENLHNKTMGELEGGEKVRVLLAQALFGNPDILLLDEPTNHLDMESIQWLENFLFDFKNTVVVVSHDRHFLNQVCTHIADIDFAQIRQYVGNYDFWYEASQLVQKQKRDEKRKNEDKALELKSFIMRFSANASKSKQATSRQKLLDKLDLENIPSSSRKFPYIAFKPEREVGKSILQVKGLNASVEGTQVLKNFEMTVEPGDRIALLGDSLTKTALMEILGGSIKAESGTMDWGITITPSYFPSENSSFFSGDENLVDWLRQYSKDQDETYVRGFLGRMLFSGDETLKPVNVLSGGEKVRCLLSKIMLTNPNFLILDEPTNHLDLESITALNTAMTDFTGCMIFTSHDHQLVSSVANRIIEFAPGGVLDRTIGFEDYLSSPDIKKLRDELYHGHNRIIL